MASHTPGRSGPTPHRQTAQKTVTVNPTLTTLSTVKQKKDVKSDLNTDALSGVQSPETTAITPTSKAVDTSESNRAPLGVTDAFFGIQAFDENEVLPDLGKSHEITNEDVLNQPLEAGSTEEELDAADTLLSLSNVRENLNLGFEDVEDNSLLMPIGGNSVIEDVAPEPLRLGQVEVDSEIAKMLTANEQNEPQTNDKTTGEPPLNMLFGVQEPVQPAETINNAMTDTDLNPLSGIPENTNTPKTVEMPTDGKKGEIETEEDPVDAHKGAHPKTTNKESDSLVTKKGSRGAFKSQLYGLRHPSAKDRSYKCKICGKSKHSMEDLNNHHRRRHGKQECEICGKKFDLATSLTHHMYTHFLRKFYCDKCDYHCHFQSELDSHKIVHREKTTFQCMYPKCGRWFKCKGELSLHVETHKKTWFDCKKCDYSTKLIKYLKEHEKSHDTELPYACDLCGKSFMWRSGVKRHKEKEHPH